MRAATPTGSSFLYSRQSWQARVMVSSEARRRLRKRYSSAHDRTSGKTAALISVFIPAKKAPRGEAVTLRDCRKSASVIGLPIAGVTGSLLHAPEAAKDGQRIVARISEWRKGSRAMLHSSGRRPAVPTGTSGSDGDELPGRTLNRGLSENRYVPLRKVSICRDGPYSKK